MLRLAAGAGAASAALADGKVLGRTSRAGGEAGGFTLYYSDAGVCDDIDNPNPPPQCEGEIPTLWVQSATFSASGTLLGKHNLTSPLEGVGYIAMKPDLSFLLFATEHANGDVETYLLPANATAGDGSAVEILNDISALLAPCVPTCVDASTFHATWDPLGSAIHFAYRVWDVDGNGIGSQGLGVADAVGANPRPLTWTQAGPDQGINIIDMCPQPLAADPSTVVFLRTVDQGATTFPAVTDANGTVTFLDGLAPAGDGGGCTNLLPTADGRTTMYLACTAGASECSFAGAADGGGGVRAVTRDVAHWRWGAPHEGGLRTRAYSRAGAAAAAATARSLRVKGGAAASDDSGFAYLSLTATPGVDPSTWTTATMFGVPLTNTTSYDDTFTISQCDRLYGPGAPTAIIGCEGTDPTHEFFYELAVNPATGNSTINSYDTFLVCMTPRCSLLVAT